jgi:hypothetical protein
MSDLFFRVFTHLLPNARAWRLTIDKPLRKFFEGLTITGSDIRLYFDLVFLDIFPATTRELSAWESQFALPASGLTEAQRRERLAATWKAIGGQSPYYIQNALQDAGFDVYIHEWWEPGNNLEPLGYPLVNKIYEMAADVVALCGEEEMQCGETTAVCNYYEAFKESLRPYIIPDDSTKWPYFLYIGGETFGQLAQIPYTRKDEFESLCLKICPAQQWLGIMVEYI